MALWAGLGVVRVAQDAFNTMWGVPIISRPTFVPKVLRSLGGLLVLGVGLVATAVVTGMTAYAPDLPGIARLVGAVLAVATGTALLVALFKVLTAAPVSFRSLVPGAIVGGVFLWILQLVGGFYMSRVIANASAVYGTFATVIGLMVWMALTAKLILLAAEVNVVADKHLWPRSFNGRNLTEADERSFSDVASRDIRRA
jgi:YihY family inner membrane protein